MSSSSPQPILLSDYQPVAHVIDRVTLEFALSGSGTRVKSCLHMRRNPAQPHGAEILRLDGEKIALVSVKINGLAASHETSEHHLTIHNPPADPFILEIETTCDPESNTALSGLYQSNGIFCTQCEAEGFRRITYFHDRPDVMAIFDVRLVANKQAFPVLLSNGNLVSQGDIPGTDDHFAIWHDPHPKPAYLFALVAGDLASVHDQFTTKSGRNVDLGIYVEKGKQDRCAWAMTSLKASMAWDETRFGLEYDLDVFNIVAVSDFNMGAMENKGLNIFNDKYILALPTTATDSDYMLIEGIIGHEYFHNWTGNRVTCREWFQLCLKEGLTVFRDQEFTADLRSRAVKRISDVNKLRMRQFPEDGGPLAHPPRPSSYIEINNFYTPTVYEKGAEICRMIHTLIGGEAFWRAMDLYFIRHDGEAATVEDFIACMADISGRDLTQFFRWYEQAGTPQVSVTTDYNKAAKTYVITLQQFTPATPGQAEKLPFHIPLMLGLVGANGSDMPLHLDGSPEPSAPLIELKSAEQVFRFTGVLERPVLSLNRGFSAPIKLSSDLTTADQIFLMGHDQDNFNRWEASQFLAADLMIQTVNAMISNKPLPDTALFAGALYRSLQDVSLDDAFKAQLLALPAEAEITGAIAKNVNADVVHAARNVVRSVIGQQLMPELLNIISRTTPHGPYQPDVSGMGQRALRSAALSFIAAADPAAAENFLADEIKLADNMTAEFGALATLASLDCVSRTQILNAFLERHRHDHLLVDKWFMVAAQISGAGAAARIEELIAHPAFKMTTPNRVYALIGGFTTGNLSGFHAADGEGYRVVADVVIALNSINPQVASRVATSFRSWRHYDEVRRGFAEAQMQRILATPALSRDVFEIISRTVQA